MLSMRPCRSLCVCISLTLLTSSTLTGCIEGDTCTMDVEQRTSQLMACSDGRFVVSVGDVERGTRVEPLEVELADTGLVLGRIDTATFGDSIEFVHENERWSVSVRGFKDRVWPQQDIVELTISRD